jgi:signal transduction histidine kinase
MNLGRMVAALRRHPLLADVTLAAALAALAALTGVALVAPRAQVEPPSAPAVVAWAVALAAPLVLRRRWPLVVLAVTTLHFTRYWAVGQLNEIASWVILGVAVYSAAAYADRRRASWVCGACLLWLIGSGVVLSARAGPIGTVEVAAIAMFDALPFLLAWPLGTMMRRLREYRAVLEERNRQLDQEREVNARRAVLEERVRIARELHDVVAHHVSVMGVQAGVALRVEAATRPRPLPPSGRWRRPAARPSPTSSSWSGSCARIRATTWPLSRACSGCPSWSSTCAGPGCRSSLRFRGAGVRCRLAWSCRLTGSSRRP